MKRTDKELLASTAADRLVESTKYFVAPTRKFASYSSKQVYDAIEDCLNDDPAEVWKFFKNSPRRVVNMAMHNAFVYNKGSAESQQILRELMQHLDNDGILPKRII